MSRTSQHYRSRMLSYRGRKGPLAEMSRRQRSKLARMSRRYLAALKREETDTDWQPYESEWCGESFTSS